MRPWIAALLLTAACSAPVASETLGSSEVSYRCLAVALPEPGPESQWLADRLTVAVDAWASAGVCVTLSERGIPVRWNDGSEEWLGLYTGTEVLLQRWALDLPRVRAEGALMHELGHALGLGHWPTGVMTPVWTVSCIDDHAAKAAMGSGGNCP
jgi:hypothetical protein